MKDFTDEIPGYMHNERIARILDSLDLKPGKEFIHENMMTCYRELVTMQAVGAGEISLLHAWEEDCKKIVFSRAEKKG